MTREIKFRGKRVDNGEWVTGDLVQIEDATFIYDYDIGDNGVSDIPRITQIPWSVIPESVGQFTGLYDKNSVEVFSGDVYDIGICTKVIRPEHFIEDTYEMMKLLKDGAVVEVIGNTHDNPSLLEVQP